MIRFQSDFLTMFQSALFQTTSSVIIGEECVVVVDPTWLPEEVAEIAELTRKIRDGRELYLLFTHSDFDHILGYGAFPDAKTIASRGFVDNPHREQCVRGVLDWDSENYIQRPYAVRYPEIDIIAQHDGQALALGEMRLTFSLAPGHTHDGLVAVVEPHGLLIAGDYLSDIEFPFITDSSTAYERTLDKLDALLGRPGIRVLIPGHGRIARDPQEMRDRVRRSRDYIRALQRHIAANDQDALNAMLEAYPFALGMKASHEGNQRLIRAEARQ